MNIIGFNFTKLSAERPAELEMGKTIDTNVEFLGFEKDELALLKDSETLHVKFRYTVSYTSEEEKKPKLSDHQLIFEGIIMLAATKEEAETIFSDWKKKEISPTLKVPLFNLVLKKCSPRALQLEEELSLPFHIMMPQVRPQAPPAPEAKDEDKK